MNYEHNPYSFPEKCRLRIVGTIEVEISYAFNLFVVWQEISTNVIFVASDSGCSCPIPFEDIELVRATKSTAIQRAREYTSHAFKLYAQQHLHDSCARLCTIIRNLPIPKLNSQDS